MQVPLPSPAGCHRRRRRNSWQLWENFIQVAMDIGNFSQMDYINTSHPNFVRGSKALEIALEQIKSSRLPISMSRTKGARPVADIERPGSADKSGNNSNGSWGFSSIFGGNASAKENSLRKTHGDPYSQYGAHPLYDPVERGQPYKTRAARCLYQKTLQTLEESPVEAETVAKGYGPGTDPTGLPKNNGVSSSFYAAGSDFSTSYLSSPKNPKLRKSSHSGEQSMYSIFDANGSGHLPGMASYPRFFS